MANTKHETRNTIFGILLAAGRSQRMGQPKQILPYAESTIIETAVQRLMESKLDKVIVVLGHFREQIEPLLEGKPVQIVINHDPKSEMLDSLRCAINALDTTPKAVLIALGDQPMVETDIINQVIDAFLQSGKGIVIPTFGGRRGHPIVIDFKYRNEILALTGEQGLKPVVRGHPEDTLLVPVESDAILRDIDTWEDYLSEAQR